MHRLAAGALCLALAGCWSVKGVREAPDIRETFTSTRPAEQLATCISDAWTERERKTKTNRTARGWSVIDESQESTFGIADLTQDGPRTSVTYSGPSAGYARMWNLLGLRSCL